MQNMVLAARQAVSSQCLLLWWTQRSLYMHSTITSEIPTLHCSRNKVTLRGGMLGCPLSWFSRKYLLFVGYKGVNKPTCFLVKLSISVPALTWTLILTEIIGRNLVPHLGFGAWGREGCGSPACHPPLSQQCLELCAAFLPLECVGAVLEALFLLSCWEQALCASARCHQLSSDVPGEAKWQKFLIKVQPSSEFAFSLMF